LHKFHCPSLAHFLLLFFLLSESLEEESESLESEEEDESESESLLEESESESLEEEESESLESEDDEEDEEDEESLSTSCFCSIIRLGAVLKCSLSSSVSPPKPIDVKKLIAKRVFFG